MICPVISAASFLLFSPILLDTIAVTVTPRPIETAYNTVIRASVIPTAATASVPRKETKVISTTAKIASIDNSIIIGIARRGSAYFIGAVVKSSSFSLSEFTNIENQLRYFLSLTLFSSVMLRYIYFSTQADI